MSRLIPDPELPESGQKPKAVFLSFVGTSRYNELNYQSQADDDPITTRYVQTARLLDLKRRGIELRDAVIFATDEAHKCNWLPYTFPAREQNRPAVDSPGLQADLTQRELQARTLAVPNGANPDEFWEIFETVADAVERGESVHADVTHGFRTQPLIMLLALDYIEQVKGASLDALTYGDSRPDPTTGVAPVWDLEPFLIVRDWSRALAMFLQYGDTRPLHRLTSPQIGAIWHTTPPEVRQKLSELSQSLKKFGEVMTKCYSPGLLAEAHKLRTLAVEAEDACLEVHELKPIRHMLHQIATSITEVGFPEVAASAKVPPVMHLRAQRAAADWCSRHGLALQSATYLREALVGALLLLAQRDILERKLGDNLLGAVHASRVQTLNPDKNEGSRIVARWLEQPPLPASQWDTLCATASQLIDHRNRLNHAYTSPGSGNQPVTDKQLEELSKSCLATLDELIESL